MSHELPQTGIVDGIEEYYQKSFPGICHHLWSCHIFCVNEQPGILTAIPPSVFPGLVSVIL
jgi:hypothetical protein